MTLTEIAKHHGKSQAFISLVKNGDRFTTDINLALQLSEITGKPPLEFVPEHHRDTFIKAYPEIFRKPTTKKKRVA